MTEIDVAQATRENLRAFLGAGPLVEQRRSPMFPLIRRWRSSTYDLLRTFDGGAWLFLPIGAYQFPELAAQAFGNEPGAITVQVIELGGGVVPGDTEFARKLELRLVAGRR